LNHDVGLAVFGTNSVANSLSVAENRRLLDALLEAGISAARMMPATARAHYPRQTTAHSRERGDAVAQRHLMGKPILQRSALED